MRLVHKLAAAAAAFALSHAAVAGVYTQSPDPATVTQGGSVTLDFLFAGDGITQDTQLDLEYDPAVFPTVTPTTLVPGSVCVVLAGPPRLRIVPPTGAGTPLTSTPTAYCRFQLTADAAAPLGDYDFIEDFIECGAPPPDGDQPCSRSGPFRVSVVDLEGPIVTFTPDGAGAPPGTPINLGAGGASTITAAVTAGNEGDSGGPDGQVNSCTLSGPDASEFAVSTPGGFPIQFTAGATGSAAINVTCDRGPADLSATLTCQVDDRNGARDEVYALTCPGAVPADLALNPNGGAFALPGGLAGSTSSRNIAVEVVTPGEAGGGNATVSCSATAGFTITGSPVTVPPGSTTGGTIGVSCTIDTVEQTGTVTCTVNDANGSSDVVFDAVCPAGSTLPPPQAIPTLSNWGLLGLILLTLGLGAGFAYRRLS